jgi:hypothetical protein
MKKTLFAALLAVAACDAFAQSGARARPPGTMPLDEPPPPPAIVEQDPALEKDVAPRVENGQTIEESRIAGRVPTVRVTPRHGRPYLLVDPRTDGSVSRQDILDPGLRVPQWVLLEF